MKLKFAIFIVPLFILLNLPGIFDLGEIPDKTSKPDIATFTNTSQEDNKYKNSLTSTNDITGVAATNHQTEIMPTWPPTTVYNKDILNLKKRNYITPKGKVAYLTIDDGPSPNTVKILSILRIKQVKATFFDVGLRIKQFPQNLRMEYNEGHAIGNHSWDHVYANVYRSPEATLDEATKTNDEIEKVLGFRTPLFRAPGGTLGNFKIATWNILDANNYLVYDWNVSSGDGAPGVVPKQTLVDRVLSQARFRDNAVILMHDSEAKNTTVQALPEMIDGLKKMGFTFEILSPDVKPPHFIPTAPVSNPKPPESPK